MYRWVAVAVLLVLVACSQAPQVAQPEPSGQEILEDMRQLGVEPEAIQAYQQALQFNTETFNRAIVQTIAQYAQPISKQLPVQRLDAA